MPTVVVHVADVVLSGGTEEPRYDAAVVVEGDRIAAVGPSAATLAATLHAHPDATVRRWRGVLTPGLVNAHTHLEYGPPFADLASAGLPFAEWITTLTARRRDLTDTDWLASARGSIHAALRTGTTCVADIVTIGPGLRAAALTGLAGTSYLEVVAADTGRWAAGLRADLERSLDEATGRATGISPHTLYTLGTEVFADTVAIARRRGLRLHPHLAETDAEVAYVATGQGPLAEAMRRFGLAMELLDGGSGRTPTGQLDVLGGLGADVHVAHGVHVDHADRATLRERGTAVALCTRSNAILAAGEAPVAAYLDEGNPLAVGTDSLASSPDLDLLAELAALRALARRQGLDPEPRRLVDLVTTAGAQAIGCAAGRIEPGARADLAVFDVPVTPDPFAALLDHGPGRCVATVLAGRLVHRGRLAA